MEQHPEKLSRDGVIRRDGSVTPFNAGDAMAVVMESYTGGVTSRQRGRLAKEAKELVDGGYAPPIVCKAMIAALYRGRIDLVQQLALDFQNAAQGQHLSWKRYQEEIESYNRSNRKDLDPIRAALRKVFK